ncbi:contact-dependent growth inhibition system immunity protein [Paenibacillus sp. NPDC057886]|uniref:contact-dependent growth inhibition system immunity protein n=1 Tax=Paenibacillus sp. NPDC057886 TaxID=3346270 RepID=UPI00368D9E21
MNKPIKEIYSLQQNIQTEESEYPLDQWYNRLIDKTIDEIELEDVSRMLAQNVFMDLGIKKALEILKDDPLAGEMYDGHLLKILYSIELNQFEDLSQLASLLQDINRNLSNIDWADEEDQEEYTELLTNFMKKLELYQG